MSKKAPEEGAVDYYVNFFNRPDIDGWLIRKGMNDLQVNLITGISILKNV